MIRTGLLGPNAAGSSKKPMLLENLLVLVSTGLLFVCAGFGLVGTTLLSLSALAFFVHHVIQFLLPSHIALPCFVVRQIPLPLAFDVLRLLGGRLVGREILKILLDRLLGNLPVLTEYIKIFPTLVTQFVFRVPDFQILELVNGASLLKNVVRADKDDVLLLEIAVGCPLVQRFGVAQGLVVARALRKFVSVLHLHFDVENACDFAIRALFLYENVVADAFVEGAVFGGFLGLGFLQVKNFNSEDCLQEGLRDVLVAEHEREHEAVRDGQLLERDVVRFHYVPLRRVCYAGYFQNKKRAVPMSYNNTI